MATAIARPSPTHSAERAETLADLLRRLGNVPARRVRLYPAPGTATEKDLIRNNESKLKTAICELVDGTLVEKTMGWVESQKQEQHQSRNRSEVIRVLPAGIADLDAGAIPGGGGDLDCFLAGALAESRRASL